MRKMIIALALVWMTGALYGQKIIDLLQPEKASVMPQTKMRETFKYEISDEVINTIFFFRPGVVITPLTIWVEEYGTCNTHEEHSIVKGCRKKVSAGTNSYYKRISVIEVF